MTIFSLSTGFLSQGGAKDRSQGQVSGHTGQGAGHVLGYVLADTYTQDRPYDISLPPLDWFSFSGGAKDRSQGQVSGHAGQGAGHVLGYVLADTYTQDRP